MSPVVFRVKRLQMILRAYPMIFVGMILVAVMRYGTLTFSNFLVLFLGSIAPVVALACLPLRVFNVVLSGNDLCAPVRKGIWFKSMKFHLSEIVLSEGIIGWIQGSKITTRNGDVLRISFPFYGKSEVEFLVNEIKKIKIDEGKEPASRTQPY